MIKDKLMPNFLDQLERTKSKDVLRQWSLVVRMLGKHLHAGADLINKVMKVKDYSSNYWDIKEFVCLGSGERVQDT